MSESAPAEGAPGGVGGPGLLRAEGRTATLTFRRLMRHPIEQVWEAITDPDQIEAWFLARTRRENSRGGRLEMDLSNGIHATGRVLDWDPPRSYEYEWNLPPGPNSPDGERSVVRWELSPAEGGTLLVVTHRNLSRPAAAIFVRGFPTLLDRLAAHLAGAPMPDAPWARAP